MIRILIFLLSVVFLAAVITWLASMGEMISGEAFGMRFDVHAGAALGAALASLIALVRVTILIRDAMSLPKKLEAHFADSRRARGLTALTRGLEAVAAGDGPAATRHARTAEKHLGGAPITRLLSAHAAQISGDAAAAGAGFAAMLEAPETEFLGLSGLYSKAVRSGDAAAAQNLAARAFAIRPNAAWAFDAVFENGLLRGAWSESRAALARAAKAGVVPPDHARRADAALITAEASAVGSSGDDARVLRELEAALKRAPDFAPAAVLAARLRADAGKRNRAARILETAFAAAPHPALTAAHASLFAGLPIDQRAEKMHRLAEQKPDAREAQIARARRVLMLGDCRDAISRLEPLLKSGAVAGEYALMGEAVAGLQGEAAARPWFVRAAIAPRDPTTGADGRFHFTRDGWARVIREYMQHGRLAPPPLEEAVGLSADELRLLSAPAALDEVQETENAVEAQGVDQPEEETAPAALQLIDGRVDASVPKYVGSSQ